MLTSYRQLCWEPFQLHDYLIPIVIEIILGLALVFGMSSLFLISSHSSESQSKAWSIYQNPYVGLLATVWSFLSQSCSLLYQNYLKPKLQEETNSKSQANLHVCLSSLRS